MELRSVLPEYPNVVGGSTRFGVAGISLDDSCYRGIGEALPTPAGVDRDHRGPPQRPWSFSPGRLDVLRWVLGNPAFEHFEMQMGTGHPASRSYLADHLTLLDDRPVFRNEFRAVGISRCPHRVMRHGDVIPVADDISSLV